MTEQARRVIIPDAGNGRILDWLVIGTVQAGTMLPIERAKATDLFNCRMSIVIVDTDNSPLAHAAVTFVYPDKEVLEIGGVFVDPGFRRQKLGHQAVTAVREHAAKLFPNWSQIALCNDHSLPIFLELGARRVDLRSADVIPPEAWNACAACPKYRQLPPNSLCCDTPVIF